MTQTHHNSTPTNTDDSVADTQPITIGLTRTPTSKPSRDGRVATIEIDDAQLIVGYGWAVYGYISPEGELSVFRGWKNFSSDTSGSITALEAVAAESLSGAPTIDLPDNYDTQDTLSFSNELIHVCTKNSEAPQKMPVEHLVFEVPHEADSQ